MSKVINEEEKQKNAGDDSSEEISDPELQQVLRDADLETDQQLQQTSMYHHYTMQRRDVIQLLQFEGHSVHSLYNLLINFIPNLKLPKHAELVSVFSPKPFLGCSYNEC